MVSNTIDNFINLVKIDKNEVLRYLGYKGQNIDSDLNSLIDNCIYETKNKMNVRYEFRDFKINKNNEKIHFENSSFKLKSKDIFKLLNDCNRCILICATLGMEIEKTIRKYSYTDLTRGVIIDACATTAIEEVCDIVENNIQKELSKQGEKITMRYSPGYGDLDIKYNIDILNLLNAQRNIGVTVTESGIMIPRKSVVAMIGVSDKDIKIINRKCEDCNNRNTCKYKREANSCGIKTIYKG